MKSVRNLSLSVLFATVILVAGGKSVMADTCYRNGDKISVRGTIVNEGCLMRGPSGLRQGCLDTFPDRPVLHLDHPLCAEDAFVSRDALRMQITMIELDTTKTAINAIGRNSPSGIAKAPDYANVKVEVGGVLAQQSPGDTNWKWVGAYAIEVNSIIPETDNAQP